MPPVASIDGFTQAGMVQNRGLNLQPPSIPAGRRRHPFGEGAFARLVMPPLPDAPGLYLWQEDDEIVYVGQTRMPLRSRLGSNGYSTISGYNTLARTPGRSNGGQQTNCRVNALANASLAAGHILSIWYQVTTVADAKAEEGRWMAKNGLPRWNRRIERNVTQISLSQLAHNR
jgi:hypothetical protein